jgi:predicted RNase H-like HicB family nuclease
MPSHKYQLVIWWSADDGLFVAEVPELPGCMAHGDTMSAAVTNAQDAMDLWLDVAREMGRPIPEPRGRTAVSA